MRIEKNCNCSLFSIATLYFGGLPIPSNIKTIVWATQQLQNMLGQLYFNIHFATILDGWLLVTTCNLTAIALLSNLLIVVFHPINYIFTSVYISRVRNRLNESCSFFTAHTQIHHTSIRPVSLSACKIYCNHIHHMLLLFSPNCLRYSCMPYLREILLIHTS